jgi:hypothetical protein
MAEGFLPNSTKSLQLTKASPVQGGGFKYKEKKHRVMNSCKQGFELIYK